LAKLRDLFSKRDPLYRATSAFVVETGKPSVSTLVNLILMQLELAGVVEAEHVPSSIAGASRSVEHRRSVCRLRSMSPIKSKSTLNSGTGGTRS
jgi:hypothetical protein